jgi:putative oxidoreductase
MINSWCNAIGLLLLRVTFGTMMLAGHGLDKLLHFSSKAGSFPDPIGLGGPAALGMATFAEFFCSALLILGLATRAAAIPLVITMLVAVTVVHGEDPWARKELAAAYLGAFTTILITGGGPFALDRIFGFRGLQKKEKAKAKAK